MTRRRAIARVPLGSGAAAGALALAALVVAWQLTPLSDWASSERLAGLLGASHGPWLAPVVATAIFTAACLLLVPVTALTVAAGLALGPALGLAVAWSGAVAASVLGYAAGRLLWHDAARRLSGERLQALNERLARNGVLSSALVRILPVAPFMVVNFVAGASHVRARDFVLGTALGTFPGAVVLVVGAEGIRALLSDAAEPGWLWAVLAVSVLAGVAAALRRPTARRGTTP